MAGVGGLRAGGCRDRLRGVLDVSPALGVRCDLRADGLVRSGIPATALRTTCRPRILAACIGRHILYGWRGVLHPQADTLHAQRLPRVRLGRQRPAVLLGVSLRAIRAKGANTPAPLNHVEHYRKCI